MRKRDGEPRNSNRRHLFLSSARLGRSDSAFECDVVTTLVCLAFSHLLSTRNNVDYARWNDIWTSVSQ
ncbi:unnamed protein product, partial [Brenthis ino]